MESKRFDGQVAIVTGAGGRVGLGRAFAMMLAERGAKVVVNDLGVGPDGKNLRPADAASVVSEIIASGGEAVADTHSVADSGSAVAIIDTALTNWGRVDILINAAGVAALGPFEDLEVADIERVVSVHLLGAIWMCRAAWRHFKSAGYGRIVNVSSRAAYGVPNVSVYGAAKSGLIGLTRALALEGAESGIKANIISPVAGTTAIEHMAEPGSDWYDDMMKRFPPELCAPVTLALAHHDCPVSGRFLQIGGGRANERFTSETPGVVEENPTVEGVFQKFEAIVAQDGAVPSPAPDELKLSDVPHPVPRRH